MVHWHIWYVPLLLIAAVLSTALALHAARRIAAPGAAMFMWLMLAVAVWCWGYAFQLGSVARPAKVFWTRVQYIGVVAAPATWLAFVLQYVGQGRWLTRRNSALLVVEPVIVWLLILTNDAHHLIWTSVRAVALEGGLGILQVTHGPMFWVHAVYSWLLLLVGSALLVPHVLDSPRLRRRQTFALLVGLLIPWLGNILSAFGWVPFPLDLTPSGFALAGLLITWALYRLRLFDIVPAARDVVLGSITDGVFVLDLQGRVVDLNPAARRMIGRSAPKVIGEQIESVLPGYADAVVQGPARGDLDEPFWGEIVLWIWPHEPGRSQRSRKPSARWPGEGQVQRHFEVQISSLYARRGRPTGQLVILHDVTERYRQGVLYRVLHALTGQLSPDSVIQTALPSIAEFAGWSNAMIALASSDRTGWSVHAAGGALSSFVGREFAVDQGIVGRAFRTGATQLVPEVKADAEHCVLHPATESALAVPLQIGDRILGVLAIESERLAAFGAEDVRLAESLADAIATTMDKARLFQATVNERQRLLTLIESSRDGIILVGMEKRMLVVNAPALEMLGLPGEPGVWTERPMRDALNVLEGHAATSAHAIWNEIKRIEAGDEPVGEGEFEVFPRSIHWLDLPVLVDGTPLGRLWVLHDVTEEKLLAKMREDLTHTMVHDLRNPLTGISTALQLLDSKLTEVITPAQHRLFEIATNSTQRMVDLVNSILDLSRLEKGQMPLNRSPLLLPDLFAETLRLQSPLYTAKHLHVESNISPTLPLAFADAEVIERVLQNIVGNAIKFTPAGGSIMLHATEWVDENPAGEGDPDASCSLLRISVTDSGPGVPPELRDKLFEKFVVGEQQGRGSGLGLAFCKLAVQAHGGDIWVESEPGKGAVFVFTLPVFQEGDVLEAM
jgi:PAS domain S-box-containing protein